MRVLISAAVAVVAIGCGGDSPTSVKSRTYDVFTVVDAFSPSPLDIAPGDTVRWNFAGGSDAMGHNVRFTTTAPGTPSQIPVRKSGTEFRIFLTRGDFTYSCDVHPGMNGEIVVK